jgi:hypothetical protein
MLQTINSWLYEDFLDLLHYGKILRAEKLSRDLSSLIGNNIYFSHFHQPHYPTFNLDAQTVFVHLNPGAGLGNIASEEEFYAQKWNRKQLIEVYKLSENASIDQWIEAYAESWRNYAYNRFERGKEFDNFDYKQACFLLNWENSGIELKKGNLKDREIQRTNSVNVINQKLQLELFPYASNSIDTNKIVKAFELEPSIIALYIENLLDTIVLYPRKYVLFGSRVFSSLFKIYHQKIKPIIELNEVEQKFKGITKNSLAFSFVRLNWKNQQINAGIAHSFPRRDLPNAYDKMAEYGRLSCEYFMKQFDCN